MPGPAASATPFNPPSSCRSLIGQIAVALHPQAARLGAYRLLAALLERHRVALQPLGPAVVMGLSRAMANEKDPRNLLVALGLVRDAAQAFPLSDELAEVRRPACPLTPTDVVDEAYSPSVRRPGDPASPGRARA